MLTWHRLGCSSLATTQSDGLDDPEPSTSVVPAEMLLGELGVGYLTWIEWNNLHIAGILFAILVIGAVGVALDAGLDRLARLVTYPE